MYGIKKHLSSHQNGTKGIDLRGTTHIRGVAAHSFGPITEANPAVHFLTAAPGRTPHSPISRLSAADRLSLAGASAADFPVHRFSLKTIYTIFLPPWQGFFAIDRGVIL